MSDLDHLDVEDLLHLTKLLRVGPVRDVGLLEAACARPQASVLGDEAYPSLELKAAALMQSLVRNHGLVDGNKRLAWLATVVFLDLDGRTVDLDDSAAFELVMPLSSRGHEALPRLRRALEERAPNIEVVLCSSAVRTVATLEGVRAALPDHVQVTIDDQLYNAGGQTSFERCKEMGDDVEGVLVVGHNPGLERLVHDLAPTGEPTARALLDRGFPTGALAELVIPGPWSALDYDSCHLAAMQIPRELP